MRLSTKKFVDYYFGGLLVFLLKPVVWFMGRVMNRAHHLEPMGEICFIKMLGGGSLIIAYPALLGLRLKYPNQKITLVTTRSIKPFAALLGCFDNIEFIDDSSFTNMLFSTIQVLWRKHRVDTVVDLEVYSRLSTIISLLTAARNRIGFYLESSFWRRQLNTHLIFFNRFSGSYRFYEAISRLLKAEPVSFAECRVHFRKQLSPSAAIRKRQTRRIAIGHGCSDFGRERILSADQWSQVFNQRLQDKSPVEFVWLGSEEDKLLADDIIRKIAPIHTHITTTNLCGRLSLKESVMTLANCDEFWGIDSGLLHFARLLGLKCISYWGPTDPQTRLKPFEGLIEEIFYRKLSCSPCIHVAEDPPCSGNNLCIQQHFQSVSDVDNVYWCVESATPGHPPPLS